MGSTRINAKEREMKERKLRRETKERDRGIRVKYPTPSRATDALIGDEEQNGKQEKGSRHKGKTPNPIPGN